MCFTAVFNLTAFVVYLFCSLSLCSFWAQKERKTPGIRVEQVVHSSARKFYEYSSFVARLSLVSAVPISGTKELASRTPGIVWHTRSDTFVLIPQLELTRAVAQTVPVLFKYYLLLVVSISRSNPLNDGTVKEHNLNSFDFWKEARTCRARCAVIFCLITQHRASSGAPKIKRNSLNDNNFSTDGYFKEIPEQRKVGLFFILCRVLWYFLSAQKVQ